MFWRTWLLLTVGSGSLALVACGSRTDVFELDDDVPVVVTADAGPDAKPKPKDAGPDAPIYVPQGKKCVRDADASVPPIFFPNLDAGPAPNPRPPQLANHGGPVLGRPTIVPITYDGDTLRNEIEDFVASVGCTPYWLEAAKDYGVGVAITGPAVHLSEAAPAKITDSQIKVWLRKKIESKELPVPAGNVLYAIYYPATTSISLQGEQSCQTFGGYHYEVQMTDGSSVPYAVLPRCDGFDGLSELDSVTGTSSHEFLEASSDPFPESDPTYSDPEPDGIAWALASGGEHADMCTFNRDAFFTPDNYPFTVERSWSNSAAFLGHDPCVPAVAGPYFGAAPTITDTVSIDFGNGPQPVKGIKIPVGQSKVVDVVVFSTNGGGGALTIDLQDLGQWLGGGTTLKLSLDKTSAQPGEILHLTIQRTGTNNQFGVSPFMLQSHRAGRELSWYGIVGD
jgi:hypothetical protein